MSSAPHSTLLNVSSVQRTVLGHSGTPSACRVHGGWEGDGSKQTSQQSPRPLQRWPVLVGMGHSEAAERQGEGMLLILL